MVFVQDSNHNTQLSATAGISLKTVLPVKFEQSKGSKSSTTGASAKMSLATAPMIKEGDGSIDNNAYNKSNGEFQL